MTSRLRSCFISKIINPSGQERNCKSVFTCQKLNLLIFALFGLIHGYLWSYLYIFRAGWVSCSEDQWEWFLINEYFGSVSAAVAENRRMEQLYFHNNNNNWIRCGLSSAAETKMDAAADVADFNGLTCFTS